MTDHTWAISVPAGHWTNAESCCPTSSLETNGNEGCRRAYALLTCTLRAEKIEKCIYGKIFIDIRDNIFIFHTTGNNFWKENKYYVPLFQYQEIFPISIKQSFLHLFLSLNIFLMHLFHRALGSLSVVDTQIQFI